MNNQVVQIAAVPYRHGGIYPLQHKNYWTGVSDLFAHFEMLLYFTTGPGSYHIARLLTGQRDSRPHHHPHLAVLMCQRFTILALTQQLKNTRTSKAQHDTVDSPNSGQRT